MPEFGIRFKTGADYDRMVWAGTCESVVFEGIYREMSGKVIF